MDRKLRDAGYDARYREPHEAHLPTQQSATKEDPRVPEANEHAGRAGGSEAPPAEGAKAADRVRSRQTFRAPDRVRKRVEYRRVYDRGRKISSRSFTLFFLENNLRRPRLGITVTRRVGGAVQRNRARRLVREWFRAAKKSLPAVDLVVNAKAGLHGMTLQALSRELDDRLRFLPRPSAGAEP